VPVLAIEYAHANYSVVANYFSNAEMRCKEHLYHAIHDFLSDGVSDFYNETAHRKFVDEMITSGEQSVLTSWAEFIESRAR
jgi:hypothetical protein